MNLLTPKSNGTKRDSTYTGHLRCNVNGVCNCLWQSMFIIFLLLGFTGSTIFNTLLFKNNLLH